MDASNKDIPRGHAFYMGKSGYKLALVSKVKNANFKKVEPKIYIRIIRKFNS